MRYDTNLDTVNLSSGLILDFVGLASEHSTSLDDVAAKTDQAVLEVSFDLARQVLGVVGDSFARVSDFSLHFNS